MITMRGTQSSVSFTVGDDLIKKIREYVEREAEEQKVSRSTVFKRFLEKHQREFEETIKIRSGF